MSLWFSNAPFKIWTVCVVLGDLYPHRENIPSMTNAVKRESNLLNTKGLTFAKHLESLDVVNGSRVKLPCQIGLKLSNADFTNISWVKMPRRILTRGVLRVTRDSRIQLVPRSTDSSTEFPLFINSVGEQDAGEYRCIFQYGALLHHKTVILIIKVPPRLEERPPSLLEADVGNNLRLYCNASGSPPPKLRWWVILDSITDSKPGSSLTSWNESDAYGWASFEPVNETQGIPYSGRGSLSPIETVLSQFNNNIFVRGGLLVISLLRRHMSGWYFCEARNDIPPPAISESRLYVRYRPEVRISNRKIQQNLGESSVIRCIVEAYPLGVVEWYLNGVPIHTPPCEVGKTMHIKFCQKLHNNDGESRIAIVKLRQPTPFPNFRPPSEINLQQTLNATLLVTNITHSDLGLYTCRMNTASGVGEDHTWLEAQQVRVQPSRLTSRFQGNQLAATRDGPQPVFLLKATVTRLILRSSAFAQQLQTNGALLFDIICTTRWLLITWILLL